MIFLKKKIGILFSVILISVLGISVSAEPEWCFGYSTTISCTGNGSNSDQAASMNSAISACESSCEAQIQTAANACQMWCLNQTLAQSTRRWCDAVSSHTSYACTINDVQYVEPGVYACTASGSTTFNCNCWHYPWDEIPNDL